MSIQILITVVLLAAVYVAIVLSDRRAMKTPEHQSGPFIRRMLSGGDDDDPSEVEYKAFAAGSGNVRRALRAMWAPWGLVACLVLALVIDPGLAPIFYDEAGRRLDDPWWSWAFVAVGSAAVSVGFVFLLKPTRQLLRLRQEANTRAADRTLRSQPIPSLTHSADAPHEVSPWSARHWNRHGSAYKLTATVLGVIATLLGIIVSVLAIVKAVQDSIKPAIGF